MKQLMNKILRFNTFPLYNAIFSILFQPVKTQQFLTVEEFFSNGFVLVGFLFVSVILRSALTQRHMHWMAVDSVHVRSALQVSSPFHQSKSLYPHFTSEARFIFIL